MPINVKRAATILRPDQSRVLLRPFHPGGPQRSAAIVARVMAVPEDKVGPLLGEVSEDFSRRHDNIHSLFLERFEQVRGYMVKDEEITEARRLLMGSFFLAEYSLESAALFNPSMVPHPDQTGLESGALRFVLSLRATGEGHISSITFRTGIIHPDHRIEVLPPAGFLIEPRQIPNAVYKRLLFERRLGELGLGGEFTHRVMNRLTESFSLADLRTALRAERLNSPEGMKRDDRDASHRIWTLARSNYEVQFQPERELSQRILFPSTPAQRNGIEDARFVQFRNDDGTECYYATFTAYDGVRIVPELLETSDFLRFRFRTLNGPAAENKGMALFPRKFGGRFAMLSRQDDENICLMFSENIHFWNERQLLIKPAFPWELIKIGNCGSPIETDAGWLVISHGVGPMRKYCIGAFLLDRDDPSKVIGRLREPLLKPSPSEREGYVPNVVYSCGAMLHDGELIIPYGLADHATGFATVPLAEVLAGMEPG
jgi:predicted GH43/DUF377 family glycosyl hydrolase